MDCKLETTSHGVQLVTPLGELFLDFVLDKKNYLRPLPLGKSELIAKAVGMAKGYRDVVDATAGLAQDAIVLARLGCKVRAVERSPWIFPLLEDAYRRVRPMDLEWPERLQFINSNSTKYLRELSESERPEVVYLDPMYPEKKKSALPRKEMQIFREVIGGDEDVMELFQAARAAAKVRVVVKRPVHAPALSEDFKHQYEGKAVRFDVY